MALAREDVLPLARELGKQAGELLTLAKHLENLDHHPAAIGQRGKDLGMQIRATSEQIRMLRDWVGPPPTVRQVKP
jgi:hypothetical protein